MAHHAPALRAAFHADRVVVAELVERWFSELTTKLLKRGAHRSVQALNTDIRAWIESWNDNPRPYVWSKPAGADPRIDRPLLQTNQPIGTLDRKHRVSPGQAPELRLSL